MPRLALGGVGHHPLDLGRRLEAQEIDAAAGHHPVAGKGNDRDAGLARHRSHSRHGLGIERAKDERGAALQHVLGCGLGPLRRALVVLDHQLQAAIVALEYRQFCRLLEAPGDDPGVALAGQWHEDRDLDDWG
jgi:hypothetical protein